MSHSGSEFKRIDDSHFFYVYKKYIATIADFDAHAQATQFLNLVTALKEIKEDNLFISIGSAMSHKTAEQRLPSYLQEIAKTESVRVFLIDGIWEMTLQGKPFIQKFEENTPVVKASSAESNKYTYVPSDKSQKIVIDIFGCYLPGSERGEPIPLQDFYLILEKAIASILDKKGKVFIGNHTQAWGLEDIPWIADSYNAIKKIHPNASGLQLYTQGGGGRVRYYLDKLYDHKSSGYREGGKFESTKGEFYVCESLLGLCKVKEFVAGSRPSGVLSSFFKKESSEKLALKCSSLLSESRPTGRVAGPAKW